LANDVSQEVEIAWNPLRSVPEQGAIEPQSRPPDLEPALPNTKARVVLITPPYDRISPGYEFVNDVTNQAPSLGLLHLAAEIRLHGYQPSIIESDIFSLTVDDVVEQVLATQPKYVGITLFTVGVWNAANISRKIKAALPATRIIVGGPHISSMATETMQRFRDFDIAVIGEGEEIFVQLLATLDAGGDLETVPGIVYMDGDEARTRPGPPINRNLDHLPMPAWDLLPDFPGAYPAAVYDFPRLPVATIAASRGCPFHCKFCDTSTFGAQVRAYSPERVFELIRHLQVTYGVRHILFVDDLFLASKPRTKRLCELIIESGMKITWSCTARVDTVKPEILALMKKAGCWEISFGLESGSNEILQSMDKAADIARSEQAIKWTAAAGIRTKGLFILGYPGETEQTIRVTKEFIRRLPIQIMNLTKFTPYPGSPIYRELYGTNIRDDHWRKMNGMNFLWAPEGMTVDDLDQHYQDVLLSFYRRPRMMWYYTKLTLRYPAHLFRLLRFLLHFAIAKMRSLVKGRGGLLLQERDQVFLDQED
jgi:anaerobic magnesium-protoporphyrin IX monomethyl ester cyclase